MEPVPSDFARRLVKWYRCSNCWKDLESFLRENDRYEVLCRNCGDDTQGYITAKSVERRRARSVGDAREVTRMLIRIGRLPNPLAGKSESDLKRELGF